MDRKKKRSKRVSDVFVSINSWHEPGTVLQASRPKEIVKGKRGDWSKLKVKLEKYQAKFAGADRHAGAAIGYFTYEGDFWFGFFTDLQLISQEMVNFEWRWNPYLVSNTRSKKSLVEWKSNFSKTDFEKIISRAQEYIRAGDIYQVNLAQRFQTEFKGDPYALFERLLLTTPAAGGAFINTGNRQILSSSPELFLKITERQIVTRPIKGTRPRDRDLTHDKKLADELRNDPKELAELIMITDLERSDLGQVCEYGSVKVKEIVKLEKHPQVFHLVSTIEGTLKKEISALSALEACFPGGSITGAPKKRAREIIAELEPLPRGVYTGAIGYFHFNGDASFNIAIRTMTVEDEILSYYVGSGITADSIPSREFEETLHKGVGMQLALDDYLNLAVAIS